MDDDERMIESDSVDGFDIDTHGWDIIPHDPSLSLLRDDFSRQLGLMSDRQNSMLQSIGIIVAFASVLFVQLTVSTSSSDGHFNTIFVISTISVLFCCIVGLYTILMWNRIEISVGMDANLASGLYNESRLENLEIKITNGIIESHREIMKSNTILKQRITYMVMLLAIGVTVLVIGWLIS